MLFMKKIQEKYPEMSPNNKKLANYLSANYDKAVFQTAKTLAKTVGVSEATVTRFAKTLGYKGYPGMTKAMSEMVRNRITTVDRLQLSLGSNQEPPLKDVINRDILNLRRTVEEIDTIDFQQAVTCISTASKIYIVSFRSAAALGTFLQYYLQMLLKNCTLICNTIKLVDELVDAGPEDLVIGISFARYTKLTVDGLQFAKERGARTLVITDTNTSPLARYGDTVLLAHRDMAYFVDSLTAAFSLINALIISISRANPKRTRERLSELEALWKQHKVYYDE